jgi:hypothetical protein
MQNPAVLWFMIKQWQIGDQNDDHNRGGDRDHPESFWWLNLRELPANLRFSGRSAAGLA